VVFSGFLLALTIIFHPDFAISTALARPIPLDPPVITVVVPLKS
jgi:hypothetical protein